MGKYVVRGHIAFLDDFINVYGNEGTRKKFKDFLRRQGFEIPLTMYIAACESNTAISKAAIESDEYDRYIVGFSKEKDSFDVYELDKELLNKRLGKKDRLNVNIGNLKDLEKKGGAVNAK